MSFVLEAVDFHHPVKLGLVMTITGRPVFNSNRSLDIEVFVDCENIVEGNGPHRPCFVLVPRHSTPVKLFWEEGPNFGDCIHKQLRTPFLFKSDRQTSYL